MTASHLLLVFADGDLGTAEAAAAALAAWPALRKFQGLDIPAWALGIEGLSKFAEDFTLLQYGEV